MTDSQIDYINSEYKLCPDRILRLKKTLALNIHREGSDLIQLKKAKNYSIVKHR